MRSQVQVLAGPPLFSQLRALPPPGRSYPLPAWAAPGPHALRAVAPKALSEQATQRPSHGRPHAGDHGPHGLRAAMPQVGNLAAYPAPYRRAVPAQPAPPGRPGGRAWPLAEDLPSTTAKPTPPLAQHGRRQLRASGSDSGRRPAGRGYRAGDHADPGRPRRLAARRIGALDELTPFGHSRRGNARIATPDAQMPGRPTGHRTPDAGRPHRTADTRTPTPTLDTGRVDIARVDTGRPHRTLDTGCC
jgi:hypothetical protein